MGVIPMIQIIPYTDDYRDLTVKLILEILMKEFGFGDIERPDIHKITEVYQQDGGNFWIAVCEKKVIGTIAIRNYGNNRGYLKRMYVEKEFRGSGLAHELMQTLIDFAKGNKYKEIYLGTVEKFAAANKFYTKHGLIKIESLPDDMPSFGDNIFYKLDLIYIK